MRILSLIILIVGTLTSAESGAAWPAWLPNKLKMDEPYLVIGRVRVNALEFAADGTVRFGYVTSKDHWRTLLDKDGEPLSAVAHAQAHEVAIDMPGDRDRVIVVRENLNVAGPSGGIAPAVAVERVERVRLGESDHRTILSREFLRFQPALQLKDGEEIDVLRLHHATLGATEGRAEFGRLGRRGIFQSVNFETRFEFADGRPEILIGREGFGGRLVVNYRKGQATFESRILRDDSAMQTVQAPSSRAVDVVPLDVRTFKILHVPCVIALGKAE